MKKGLELPINMIVIIALAVLILVIVTAFTTGQVGQGVSTISQEAAFTQLCTQYRNAGCGQGTWGAYSTNVQGAGSLTLQRVCQNKFGTSTTEAVCAQNCGCLTTPTAGGGGGNGLPSGFNPPPGQ